MLTIEIFLFEQSFEQFIHSCPRLLFIVRNEGEMIDKIRSIVVIVQHVLSSVSVHAFAEFCKRFERRRREKAMEFFSNLWRDEVSPNETRD